VFGGIGVGFDGCSMLGVLEFDMRKPSVSLEIRTGKEFEGDLPAGLNVPNAQLRR
jgi:hypothetical protein